MITQIIFLKFSFLTYIRINIYINMQSISNYSKILVNLSIQITSMVISFEPLIGFKQNLCSIELDFAVPYS